MRTLPAGLDTALIQQRPYIKLLGQNDSHVTQGSIDVIAYTFDGVTLKATVPNEPSNPVFDDNVFCIIRRGAYIAGTPTYIDSSALWTRKRIIYTHKGTQVLEASLFPRQQYDGPATDPNYEDLLTDLASEIGFSADFVNPTADYWAYQFYPTGRALHLNDTARLLPLLLQKFLMRARDAGAGTIAFYAAPSTETAYDLDLPENTEHEFSSDPAIQREMIWRDDAQTVHTTGTTANGPPLHNLGYIPTAGDAPRTLAAQYATIAPEHLLIVTPITLLPESGDRINVAVLNGISFSDLPYRVTEVLNPRNPISWTTELQSDRWFSETEAGPLPSTIEHAAPYTPLNTSNFDNLLSDADNNIQTAFETLDDHAHSPGIQRNLAADLTLLDGESLVLSHYFNTNGHTLDLQGDATLHVI